MKDFGRALFFLMVEGMEDKEVAALKEKVEQVEHVDSVLWYDDIADISVPKELLPKKYYDAFNAGDMTMMAVFFDETTSADGTMDAVNDIRSIAGSNAF